MLEKFILLKQFILNAPASQDEHSKAMNWLNGIMSHFSKKIKEQNSEIEELKTQIEKCGCQNGQEQNSTEKNQQIKKVNRKK